MTSELSHRGGSYGNSASNPIHFFKIMLRDTLLQGKLRIPTKFVRKYGKHLSDTMFLKLPNGAEWKVNLEKRDANVWFEEGWKEFAEYHSLAHGHLFLFRYDGTSNFYVLICDMSAMEIDYPDIKVNHKRSRINSEEIQPHKMPKIKGNQKKCNSNLQDTVYHQNVRDHKGKLSIEGPSNCNCGALEATGNISFTVIMKSNHLKKQYMYLPQGPLKRYIKPGEQHVTLLVGDKSWRVKLNGYLKSGSYFTQHWAAFAKDNDLKRGDASLFQLLNSSDEMVMKVSISRH